MKDHEHYSKHNKIDRYFLQSPQNYKYKAKQIGISINKIILIAFWIFGTNEMVISLQRIKFNP